VSMKQYNKIVRDKIPQIIESHGRKYSTRIATREESISLLKAKLLEEFEEFDEDDQIEELADILEVVYAIGSELGTDRGTLEELRARKRDSNGGFESRIVLIEAEVPAP
jgi:predicted house-cleaning noncanonical NTP pyrophosphatase (MazG superfamily)